MLHLHLGHDRPAQGRGAHALRLPDQGRAGHGARLRRAAGETMYWVSDIGWMMGPWELFGMTLLGGTAVLYDGALDYPGPGPAVGAGRTPRRQHPRRLAHAHPLADAARRRAGARSTTCRRCASSAPPASRGTPSRGAGSSTSPAAGALPIINYSGGTEVSGGLRRRQRPDAAQAGGVRRPAARHRRRRGGRSGPRRCATASASWWCARRGSA